MRKTNPNLDKKGQAYAFEPGHKGYEAGATYAFRDANTALSQTWSLTPTGNWSSSMIDGNNQTRTHDNANQITSISGVALAPLYDQAGSNVRGPRPADPNANNAAHFRYDAWNRLSTVHLDNGVTSGTLDANDTLLATYRYDGLNRRVMKVVAADGNSVTEYVFHNEGWQVVEIRRGVNAAPASTAYKQFVYDIRYIDAPVCRWWDKDSDGTMEPAAGEMQYFTNDGNFNTTALVDANSGSVVERYLYDPYGRVTVLNGASGAEKDPNVAEWSPDADNKSDWDNEILFCGYWYDPETGLFHVRERYYDPITGTWKTRDRILYPDGMNLYEYVRSTPVVAVDPVGEVYIEGWDLYGMKKDQIKAHIMGKVGKAELAEAGVTGKLSVTIGFKDETDEIKLKWFAGMLKESFVRFGAKEAADHFDHWMSGSGDPLPVKVGTFKGTRSYRILFEGLKRDCIAGGNKTGVTAASEYGNDFNVYVLLGGYSYQWKLDPKKDNCCSVHFTVDDDYDFHFGKEAVFENSENHTISINTISIKGMSVEMSVNVEVRTHIGVPDSVLVNLKKVSGAKDFKRITNWDDTIVVGNGHDDKDHKDGKNTNPDARWPG